MTMSSLNPPGAEPFPAAMTSGGLLDLLPPGAVTLYRRWWLIGLRGSLSVLFGLMALILPVPTIGTLLLVVAAYLLADGVLSIAAAARAAVHRDRWGLLVLEGVLDLALAAAMLAAPIATVLAFVALTAAWAFVSGAVLLAAAIALPALQGRGWMALAALASLLWGAALFAWPAAGAVVLTWWLAAYALLFGLALIALSLRLRRAAAPVALD
jgi:uncharacterized membrane protein HdeD (DUF308 family)